MVGNNLLLSVLTNIRKEIYVNIEYLIMILDKSLHDVTMSEKSH
jgi:hypothetical protein